MLKLTLFEIDKNDAFTEVNSKGLLIYNTPTNYIKFGSGVSEIKIEDLKVNNISVMGNLYVYGEQIAPIVTMELYNTIADVFTIGADTTSGTTSLILGKYSTPNSLITDGNIITSSVPITAPDLKIGNNSVLSKFIVLHFVPDTMVVSNVPIALPNENTYIMGTNRLLVFLDGRLQKLGATADYIEVSPTQISFNMNIAEDAIITFIIIG